MWRKLFDTAIMTRQNTTSHFMRNSSSKIQQAQCCPRFLLLAIALTIFRVGMAAAQSDPTEKLPMYGQPGITRPENLKIVDEDVIRDATLRFGNRQAASRALAEQGWTSIRRGMFDVAMRRFNEAWLLNPKNYQAF